MRVLHVCETVIGGTGVYLNELLPLLCPSLGADNVRLIAPAQHMFQIPDIDQKNIRAFDRGSRLKGLPFLFWAILKEIIRFKPDIIHAHSTFAGVTVRLIAPFFRIPVVYCPHGWAMEREQPEYAKFLTLIVEKSLALLTKTIVAISEHERVLARAIGIPEQKIIKISNGIRETPPAYNRISWKDERTKALFVGRLDQQKGVDIFLSAIKDRTDKVTARIIGDAIVGKEKIDFHAYSNVEPLGWCDASVIAANIDVCDVVVMPSRWEGFGLVAIEAMRQGKPVIAARVGGLQELVEDGVTGYLFPAGSSSDLATLLDSLDRAKLSEMGKAGRDRFLQKYTAKRMTDEIIRLYSALYESRSA